MVLVGKGVGIELGTGALQFCAASQCLADQALTSTGKKFKGGSFSSIDCKF
jgi:hypothetical protein